MFIKIIGEMKELDEVTSNMLKSFFQMIFKCFKDVTKEEIVSFVEKANLLKLEK